MASKTTKTTKLPKLEVILPVFNEVQNIQPLLRALDKVATSIQDEAQIGYLFINDGSSDGTSELLESLYRERDDVRVVDLIHNFGHSAALSCGMDFFDGDVAAVMDADGQDDPAALVAMFRSWQKGAKTVVAQRGQRKERARILFKAFYFILHRLNETIPPIEFGTHCLLDKRVVERIKQLPEKNRYFPGLVSYSSSKIYPLVVDRQSRKHGASRVGTWGLMNLAVTAFLSFSTAPVRLVSLLGLVSAFVGFGVGIHVLYKKLFTDQAIAGWASTMSMIAFSGGVQLLCLGIIGEYLARVYEEVKQRPMYLVDRHLNPAVRARAKSRNRKSAA